MEEEFVVVVVVVVVAVVVVVGVEAEGVVDVAVIVGVVIVVGMGNVVAGNEAICGAWMVVEVAGVVRGSALTSSGRRSC